MPRVPILGADDRVQEINLPTWLAQSALSSKADLVGGVIPTSQIPAIAISDTYVVATQAAMLALTAQRGDFAIRTDFTPNRVFLLKTDSPTTLADWHEVAAGGSVTTVNGQSGAVVLGKADIGLGNVDNTSDASKPVSTATATALAGKASTLSTGRIARSAAPTGSVFWVRKVGGVWPTSWGADGRPVYTGGTDSTGVRPSGSDDDLVFWKAVPPFPPTITAAGTGGVRDGIDIKLEEPA